MGNSVLNYDASDHTMNLNIQFRLNNHFSEDGEL